MFAHKSVSRAGKGLLAAVLATALLYVCGITNVQAGENVPVQEITQSINGMGHTVFPIGEDNIAFEKYFTGKSYLSSLASGQGVGVTNVTFAPGTINHWHIHHKSCQVLVGVSGNGWYQIWGQEPQKMTPGVTVTIPEGIKHWHGAANDSWFQHLSIMQDGATTEWLEPVDEAAYQELEQRVIALTESGQIRGFTANGVDYYRGIPYAKPPVGELRWQPPMRIDSWQGVLDATQYRNEAAQTAYLGVFATAGGSEDCLYLNIAVPHKQPGDPEKLPVFVWIHGGALVVGSGNDYNPELLAKEGRAVIVTINYRLGVFGFFAHPAIDAEKHPIINYGVMDQIAALEWVQRNIGNFSGDLDNVTIAGESSGGQSAQILMASPKAKGLFKNIIAMSSPVMYADGHSVSREKAEERGIGLAKAAGLNNATAQQLRALSTEELLALENDYVLDGIITIDSEYVPASIAQVFQNGNINGERLAIGNVRNEGSFFAALSESASGKPMDEAAYRANLEALEQKYSIPGFAEKVMKEYPVSDYRCPAEAYAQVITDSWFASPIYRVADYLDNRMKVYYYEFSDPTNPQYIKTNFQQGTAHTYELPYLFPGFHGSSELSTELNDEQQKVSRLMARLWVNMSEVDEQGLWQQFDSNNAKYLKLGQAVPQMSDIKDYKERHHFDFWKNINMH